jgi:hypothetical protein
MKHPSSMSLSRIRANLTRCRTALDKAQAVLANRLEEIDLVSRQQNPPTWLLQRLKANETSVWFYETRIREYEEWLRNHPILTPEVINDPKEEST